MNYFSRVFGNQKKELKWLRDNTYKNYGTTDAIRFDIQGINNEIIINSGARITNMLFFIRGNNHKIFIGEKCRIDSGELWLEDEGGKIKIAENTTIENAHFAVTEPGKRITLGQDCMLAKNIEIRTGDSHSIIDANTGERINYGADVIIGNHVWIGGHAKILKGVTIGDNSIIGLNSVVTKDVPSHVVVSGIPARVIRTNVNWKRERTY